MSPTTPPPPPIPSSSAPLPPYYSKPSPPRNFVFSGLGWAYGLGCGAGPFFGIGVAVNRTVLFGAGASAGVYCGIGFGAGAIIGTGTGFIPVGLSSSLFYAPRIGWAEDLLQRYHLRHHHKRQEIPWGARLTEWWRRHLAPRLAPILHPKQRKPAT